VAGGQCKTGIDGLVIGRGYHLPSDLRDCELPVGSHTAGGKII